jgi:hypothetical protein
MVRTLFPGSNPDTIVYVQMEGLSDVATLAVHVMYQNPDSLHGVTVVPAQAHPQYGWADSSHTDLVFGSDSTYDWAIHFPAAPAERIHIVYGIYRFGDAFSDWARVSCLTALVTDHAGATDTIAVVGDCRVWLGSTNPVLLARAQAQASGIVPGKVVLRLPQEAVSYSGRHIALADLQSTWQIGLEELGFQMGARVFDQAALPADSMFTTEGGLPVRLPDLSRWYVFKMTDSLPPETLAVRVAALMGAAAAQPVRVRNVHREPNDPSWSANWYLPTSSSVGIGATPAWDAVTGSDSVRIAIIDTGVDYTHPDLDPGDRSRVLPGIDTGDDDSDPINEDWDSHGTGVAGLAAAWGNNNLLMSGVMWRGRILPIKASENDDDYVDDDNGADGVYFARTHGADIANMSWGGPSTIHWYDWTNLTGHDPLTDAISDAFVRGVALFASTGNDSHRGVDEPACLPYICAVGSSDENGTRTASSNWGPEVSILAPGSLVYTLAHRDHANLRAFGGTSAASPVAAGVAGLVKAYALRNGIVLTNQDLYECLKQSAVDIAQPGWDEESGWGRVSAARAVGMFRAPFAKLQGTIGGSSTRVTENAEIRFLDGGPLTPGVYYCDRYKISAHVSGCANFDATPFAWGRGLASRGYDRGVDNGAVVTGIPWSGVENVTTSGFDVVTYVYYVKYSIMGAVYQWYPCRPEQALMAYMAFGPMSLQAIQVNPPSGGMCAGSMTTWSTTMCGGETPTYEWRERIPGQPWSDVVGTGATYSRLGVSGSLEVKVTAVGASRTTADSVTVSGQVCTVGVGETPRRPFEFAVLGNPMRGVGGGWVEVGKASRVTIDVFDVSGRRTCRVLDRMLPQGQSAWTWDGRADDGSMVGGGLYFVRATCAAGTKTIRVAVLR